MVIASHITELIGNTPLVKLNKIVPQRSGAVVAKLEYFNPGASAKDRIAVKMIEAAEQRGDLLPGGVIVEPTSGNTGVGLALVAQLKGYRCVFVCPDKVSEDKLNVLKAYGAEIVVCPTAVPPQDPSSYYSVSDRLAQEIPKAWKPNQYTNMAGPESHYETTGPEIWEATNGKITHFVCGIGTGGTISGAGKYLKDISQGRVKVIGVDPVGSVYSTKEPGSYLIEGVGEDFWPETFDTSIPDEIIAVSDAAAFKMTRDLAKLEGILVGGSCGMATVAALEVAKREQAALVVVLFPDGGRGYLSKIFNDKWMLQHGFINRLVDADSESNITAGSLVPELAETIWLTQDLSLTAAAKVFMDTQLSVLPVVTRTPPISVGEILGSLTSQKLLKILAATETRHRYANIAEILEPKLPFIGVGDTVKEIYNLLIIHPGVIMLDEGKPVATIYPHQVLSTGMG